MFAASSPNLDLVHLMVHATLPVKCVIAVLALCSLGVWFIALLKLAQLARLRSREETFEAGARRARTVDDLMAVVAATPGAPGARVVVEMSTRGSHNIDRLRAVADRAIVAERKNGRSLLAALGSIATAAPFVGLFGTVWGIMDAFVRIGAAKSASLTVVAPAIGEALITTAIGLGVAIPAVVFYNSVDKRVADLVAELEASAAEWVVLFAEAARWAPPPARTAPPPAWGRPLHPQQAMPSAPPPARGSEPPAPWMPPPPRMPNAPYFGRS